MVGGALEVDGAIRADGQAFFVGEVSFATVGDPTSMRIGAGVSVAGSTNTTAIGEGAAAVGVADGVALGDSASLVGDGCVAVGAGASTTSANGLSVAIGNLAIAGHDSVAIGQNVDANQNQCVAVGQGSRAAGSNSATAVGHSANANAINTVALGRAALANASYAVSIGRDSVNTGQHGLAIGHTATVSANNGVAIGQAAQVQAGHTDAMAFGRSAITTAANRVTWGTAAVPLSHELHDGAQILLPGEGTAVNPTIDFDGQGGFFESGGYIYLSASGSNRFRFNGSWLQSATSTGFGLKQSSPSNINPNICPKQNDPDTGIGSSAFPAEDEFSLIAGGVEAIRFTEVGGAVTVDVFETMVEHVSLSTNVDSTKRIETDQTVNLGSGPEGDLTADGLAGGGSLTINGTWDAATLASGPTSGTAQAGTSSTQLTKDGATVAWTAGDLRGKHLRVTSGAADGEVRPIHDNDAHTCDFDTITGFASGDGWEVVEVGTQIGTLVLRDNTPQITITACEITTAILEGNANVTLNGAKIVTSLTSNRDRRLSLQNITNEGSMAITDGGVIEAVNHVGDDVSWQFTLCENVTALVNVDGASATPVLFDRCNFVQAGGTSSNNTGDGFEFVSCPHVSVYGNGLLGSGNSGYGARFGGGGRYVMDGATVTGTTNDFIIEDQAVTWALLAANEAYVELGATVLVVGG